MYLRPKIDLRLKIDVWLKIDLCLIITSGPGTLSVTGAQSSTDPGQRSLACIRCRGEVTESLPSLPITTTTACTERFPSRRWSVLLSVDNCNIVVAFVSMNKGCGCLHRGDLSH
jgi:hypothetical protein